jgi:hypothetical protein
MPKKVYIVEGQGLPPKAAIVDLALPHETLFEIENRFERNLKYTHLKQVESGMLLLARAEDGAQFNAFLPGNDDAKVECDGQQPTDPSEVIELPEAEDGPRDVWEVRYAGKDGASLKYLLVTQETGHAAAVQFAEALANDFAAGTLELKRVLAGSYTLDRTIAAPGYKALLGPATDPAHG